ncbi:MAG: FAD-dependent oxidoreductase [bacterium]
MKIVVIGGSFGGLTAAHELRRLLPAKDCDVTLISKDRRFVFIPSLPWVAMGTRTLERISFDLEKPLEKKRIRFIEAEVLSIDPKSRKVLTAGVDYSYDFLVIATGHRSANEAVPGLGPGDGPGHSLMSPPEAMEARDAIAALLKSPGPVVIGCAPGASCIGPAYELAFELDHHLKRRGLRNKAPINFVTPEPFLGHFGVGGVGKARQFLEGEFEHRDIRYHTSAAVTEITPERVALASGKCFDSIFSMIIPPLNGVKAIVDSPGLGNPKGFIPIDAYHRHREFPEIYAVGVAVAYPPVEETPVPVNFPKTGHMTEQMALTAARNIAAETRGAEMKPLEPFVECIMDMGDKAARMLADPVRPPRNRVAMSHGRHWLWAKKAFEKYFLWKIKRGALWLP